MEIMHETQDDHRLPAGSQAGESAYRRAPCRGDSSTVITSARGEGLEPAGKFLGLEIASHCLSLMSRSRSLHINSIGVPFYCSALMSQAPTMMATTPVKKIIGARS
jgi:hypothetical protein